MLIYHESEYNINEGKGAEHIPDFMSNIFYDYGYTPYTHTHTLL